MLAENYNFFGACLLSHQSERMVGVISLNSCVASVSVALRALRQKFKKDGDTEGP